MNKDYNFKINADYDLDDIDIDTLIDARKTIDLYRIVRDLNDEMVNYAELLLDICDAGWRDRI